MLSQYKNINQIKLASSSLSGERFSRSKTNFLSFDAEESIYFNTSIVNQLDDQRIELHVYSDETWITGKHRVGISTSIPRFRDTSNKLISFPAKPIAIDIYQELESLKLTSGQFRIVINFFKNLIGTYEKQLLRIDEISPDRREIRLRAIDNDDPDFLVSISNFIRNVNQTNNNIYKTYLLNFSRNTCVTFINSVVIGEYLYVKLESELPTSIDVDFKCWVVEEQKDPYVDRISVLSAINQKQFNVLANPNWEARIDFALSSETDFRNWTDILGSSTQTSQQIIDTYFSGSLNGIDLNIDYSDFNNFIFYSSAVERLKNFRFKLSLLEYYTSQSLIVAEISGANAVENQQEYNTYKTNLISGFDGFEKYLYYESASYIQTSNPIASETFVVADLTGSYITPAPKSNTTYPYALYPVGSSEFTNWYVNLLETASLYDSFNLNSLEYALPEYIRFDPNNESVITFVRMLGQHYDILYSYINSMLLTQKRIENPKLGMPNELLYTVAKQFGWELVDGNRQTELWSYALGVNETGSPTTGSNSVNGTSLSAKNRTFNVWRRIVNNLPYLLKTKGTKRSIQALLACYGIPQTMISIHEYGGPRIDRAPVYEKLNFDYALDLIGNTAGIVTVNYTDIIKSVEIRIRPESVLKNPTIPNTMNIITVGGNVVTLDYVSGTRGTFSINGIATAPLEVYNEDWVSILLRNNISDTVCDLIVKKSKYGKIIAAVSASAMTPFSAGNNTVLLGDTTNGARFVGQYQELRLWSSRLSDSAFNNHVKAPAAYDGNADAYSELLFRLPLTQQINHALTGSLVGVQPAVSNISASFTNWTLNTPYDSIEETYYYDAISLGAGTFDDNKIRIESNELVGVLDVKTRAERSQFDLDPLDSNKLGVYFSPQTMINEDIIAQLGFVNLDDYIGDPGISRDSEYNELIQFSQNYWKKYETKNDINAYLKIFTLFDLSFFKQLEQVLPGRVNKMTGILVQPNVLERNKQTILPAIEPKDLSYYITITDTQVSGSGNYLNYAGNIDGKIVDIEAIDDDQLQMYLTASADKRYSGTTYSYEYLVLSGSAYITASTPYWRSETLCPTIISSMKSEFKLTEFIIDATSSYQVSQVSDYLPTGITNQRYDGSKITSAGFNINSPQTVDGGPVVEWRTSNPNQLIYQTTGEQGSFRLT
jgi:hypothetical protein